MQTIKQESHSSSHSSAVTTPVRRLLRSALCALGAGLTASLTAVLIMGILRLVAGIPTPVELFSYFVLTHINVDMFISFLILFNSSKIIPLGLALLGMIGLGTLLGLLYAALARVGGSVENSRPTRREWIVALIFAGAMALVALVLFWDDARQNLYGLPIDWARLASGLGLLVVFTVYGVTLCLAYRILLPKNVVASANGAKASSSRRQLLSRAGVATLAVGSGAATAGLIRAYLNNTTTYDGQKAFAHNGVTAPITPNSEHYVVTQNPIDPKPAIDLWRLDIGGLVNKSGSYTFAELQQLPSTSRAITLECIANGRGDHLISTAIWQGVALRTLLERHGGASAEARHVVFYSVDGYTISLPLDEVLAADTLLAWRMNGEELPERHGYPLRALIPGRYGEENPKWLTRIELSDHVVGGLYVNQGWYNGPLHAMTRIDRPHGQVALGQSIEVGGIAYTGNRGVQKVEISTDAGATWNTATLQPPLSQDAWVAWTWQWRPLLPGAYTLVARATDGAGVTEASHEQGTVPNGATGYHKVKVQVS